MLRKLNKKLSCHRQTMMLCVIKYFAKTLKVIRNDTLELGVFKLLIALKLCPYLVPFLRYSASNNSVTLKPGYGLFKVVESGTVR